MTTFWIAAAGLVGLAWLIVLPSLLRRRGGDAETTDRSATLQVLREQLAQVSADGAAGRIDAEQQAAATADIERRARAEGVSAAPGEAPAGTLRGAPPAPVLAAVTAAGILAVAGAIYARVGNREALQPAAVNVAAPAASAASGAITLQQVEAMVDHLAERLATDPALANDARAWAMLARSSAALRRYEQAKTAFVRAVALSPNDAQLLVDQADVLAMLQGQTLDGEPARLVDRALQLQPENIKALAMAGSLAFERADYTEAVRRWSTARRLVEAGSDLATGLDRSIAAAQQAAAGASGPSIAGSASTGGGGESSASAGEASAAAPNGVRSIVGRVSVVPSLAGRIAPADTVFVYARSAQGPRMPLAIVRRPASALPFDFVLDDSTAMSPGRKLSNGGAVVVGARVSHSGDALPHSGDLEAAPRPAADGTQGLVDLRLDSIVP